MINVLFIVVLFSISFGCALENYTNAELDVSVSIPATMQWAEIELNISGIDFGSINISDELSSTQKEFRTKYKIRNRGNVNITVTPILDNSDSLHIFDNLWFGRTYTSGWEKIGEYDILMNSTAPDMSWSGWIEQSVKLDLSDYTTEYGQVPFDIVDHESTVVFEVLPRYY